MSTASNDCLASLIFRKDSWPRDLLIFAAATAPGGRATSMPAVGSLQALACGICRKSIQKHGIAYAPHCCCVVVATYQCVYGEGGQVKQADSKSKLSKLLPNQNTKHSASCRYNMSTYVTHCCVCVVNARRFSVREVHAVTNASLSFPTSHWCVYDGWQIGLTIRIAT